MPEYSEIESDAIEVLRVLIDLEGNEFAGNSLLALVNVERVRLIRAVKFLNASGFVSRKSTGEGVVAWDNEVYIIEPAVIKSMPLIQKGESPFIVDTGTGDNYITNIMGGGGPIAVGSTSAATMASATGNDSVGPKRERRIKYDEKLYNKIKNDLRYAIDYIRGHDFGGSSLKDSVEPLYEVSHYFKSNPSERFFDSDMESVRSDLIGIIFEFTETLSGFTVVDRYLLRVPVENRDGIYYAKTPLSIKLHDEYYENVRRLNELANGIVLAYDKLMSYGRDLSV